tara:strand:+ start:792 stop:1142 length:351 start_codon:yes stop_codon:yes gene_type:complete
MEKGRLHTLIENKVPCMVCFTTDDRFSGFGVEPSEEFIVFHKKHTGYVHSPLKEADPELKGVITLPMSKVDKKFFKNNISKFNKQYETAKSKIYETGYESFKEFYTNYSIRKTKRR